MSTPLPFGEEPTTIAPGPRDEIGRRGTTDLGLFILRVTVGVLLHLPMYWMGRSDGFRLVDMPMDAGMLWGMAAIVVGAALAAWGLMPTQRLRARAIDVAVPEDAPLGRAHYRLMLVLTGALVIDVMKPASLGFVLPGMRNEYGLDALTVAWLPFAALCGTAFEWLSTGRGTVVPDQPEVPAVSGSQLAQDELEDRLLIAFRRIPARKRPLMVQWMEGFF